MIRSITHIIGSIFLSAQIVVAQEKTFVLPESLNELSGLEQLDETTLVGINDGDDGPTLYVLEMDGKLRKKVHVAGAKNKDWEELARDENYLYIGDIGNNRNKRENLRIYRVEIKEVLDLDTVSSERINIGYTEQKEFPPTSKADLNFDAEGMACYGGELWVFTKPNTDPWHGKTFVYRFPKTPGTYTREKHLELYIGDGGWWSDAITAADFHNNTLYVSTYNRLITLNFAKGGFLEGQTVGYSSITQKEALLVLDNGMLLIGDEKHTLLGGGKLYLMKLPND